MLGNAGHDAGTPDGKFGRHTQRATKSLQKAAHLAQDGVLGKQSWGALLRAQP
jgi:peptidoglycan hydrolase-like protein with peptidoglycan-binding domain